MRELRGTRVLCLLRGTLCQRKSTARREESEQQKLLHGSGILYSRAARLPRDGFCVCSRGTAGSVDLETTRRSHGSRVRQARRLSHTRKGNARVTTGEDSGAPTASLRRRPALQF